MRNIGYLLICTLLVFTSCEDNPLKKVDVSKSKVDVKFDRLDRDIFNADFEHPVQTSQTLYQKYGSFYCDYLEVILQAAPCFPDSNILVLEDFITHRDMVGLQRQIDKKFSDENIKSYESEFKDAIKRWNHFFPDSIVPRVVFMNSGLNFSAYSTDSIIGVGLEFFLGPEDSIVKLFPNDYFPQYFKDDMRPDYMVANAMKDFAWAQCNKVDRTNQKSELLNLIVHQGKVMYLLDALRPFEGDSIKMNWSSMQQEWAEENEVNIWKTMAQQDILFRSNYNENKKWIDFAPFTNVDGVPQDSPPQLGIWIGWNMVRAYMKANPDVSLQQMLAENDVQKFLTAYKPKK
ncbi:MAG: hypothetical protein R2809_04505 [Flavobacteriales bacterium]